MCTFRKICTIAEAAGQLAALQGQSIDDIIAAMIDAAEKKGEKLPSSEEIDAVQDEMLPLNVEDLFRPHAEKLFEAAAARREAVQRQQVGMAAHAAALES
jgi:hypothetical protein